MGHYHVAHVLGALGQDGRETDAYTLLQIVVPVFQTELMTTSKAYRFLALICGREFSVADKTVALIVLR